MNYKVDYQDATGNSQSVIVDASTPENAAAFIRQTYPTAKDVVAKPAPKLKSVRT